MPPLEENRTAAKLRQMRLKVARKYKDKKTLIFPFVLSGTNP
jgi:hypothetical protein